MFIIHKDAMQRVPSRVERDRAGQVRKGQPQRSKQEQGTLGKSESGNLRGASRGKQGMMAGTGPATVSGAASALLQSSLENSCEGVYNVYECDVQAIKENCRVLLQLVPECCESQY